MAPSKVLVVIGATGNQGGSVINSILGDPEAKDQFALRGTTRDPQSAKAKELTAKGVECVKADIDSIDSLKEAFKGAHSVFAVTDFWAHNSKEREEQQGRNIADACKAEGVQHLVFSSLQDVEKITNGSLSGVLHFDSKAHVEDYIRKLGIPATFFQPGFYMSNITSGGQLRKDQESGTYSITLPVPGNTIIPAFDAAADTGKFVKAILLHRDEVLGERVYAAAEYISLEDLVETFKKVYPNAGKEATFRQAPRDVFKGILTGTGMPDAGAEDLVQMFEFFEQKGYYNGAALEGSLKLLKEKPTTFEDHIRAFPGYKDLN